MFNEANERPRHATATVVIRSIPIAPEWASDGDWTYTGCTAELYIGSGAEATEGIAGASHAAAPGLPEA